DGAKVAGLRHARGRCQAPPTTSAARILPGREADTTGVSIAIAPVLLAQRAAGAAGVPGHRPRALGSVYAALRFSLSVAGQAGVAASAGGDRSACQVGRRGAGSASTAAVPITGG